MSRRLSLRTRATFMGAFAFTVVLIVGSMLLVTTLENRLTTSSDQVSRARAVELLDLAKAGDLPTTLRNIDDNGMAQVVDASGQVLAASPNLKGRGPVANDYVDAHPTLKTIIAPDDQETETYRVWLASGSTPYGLVTVYVGNGLESVAEASAALRRALGVGVPLVGLTLGMVIWLLLGRALGRLDRIRAEVDRISAENLQTRVAGDGVDDEVGRLAATMNAMLSRLEVSVQQQRDFVADVSHDLQSPLAAQRIALELALAAPGGTDATRLRADVLGPNAEMERLVSDLLLLASVDADVEARPSFMDLDAVVLEEATRARAVTQVDIRTREVSAAPAYADPDDTRRIVRNLIENATAHATSVVDLVVVSDVGRARLDVHDDGPGIPDSLREHAFDRFRRGATSRPRNLGSGLGLSIARGLAERNGGRVDLVRQQQRGAHFRLLLPATPARSKLGRESR